MCFSQRDPIDTVTLFEKHILSFSRPGCHGILIWWNLKGLVELANLTVMCQRGRSLNATKAQLKTI